MSSRKRDSDGEGWADEFETVVGLLVGAACVLAASPLPMVATSVSSSVLLPVW